MFYILTLPFLSSLVMVPSPGGFPSWSLHFQSMPRTALAPGTICLNVCVLIILRNLLMLASASLAALPGNYYYYYQLLNTSYITCNLLDLQ